MTAKYSDSTDCLYPGSLCAVRLTGLYWRMSVNGAGQAQRAQSLRQLHETGRPLILANVWDAASARMVAIAGAKAVATSSGAVSWAHGVRDGGNLDLDTVCVALREIVAAGGGLPVTADIEGGYAQAPEGVEALVAAVIDA